MPLFGKHGYFTAISPVQAVNRGLRAIFAMASVSQAGVGLPRNPRGASLLFARGEPKPIWGGSLEKRHTGIYVSTKKKGLGMTAFGLGLVSAFA